MYTLFRYETFYSKLEWYHNIPPPPTNHPIRQVQPPINQQNQPPTHHQNQSLIHQELGYKPISPQLINCAGIYVVYYIIHLFYK